MNGKWAIFCGPPQWNKKEKDVYCPKHNAGAYATAALFLIEVETLERHGGCAV